jgi:TFIIF-interacting CTD phosphatase-like protein
VQVHAFLAAVSQLYELHIYTMGDKGYAALMADLLDPEHRLFVGRVISAVGSPRWGIVGLSSFHSAKRR